MKKESTPSLEKRIKTLGAKGLQKFTRENMGFIQELLNAREFAKSERARVDEYTTPILLAANLRANLRSGDGTKMIGHGEQITDRKHVYLCDDEDACRAYYEACRTANIEHGWTGNPMFCPALVAENEVSGKECELISRFSVVCHCPEFNYCSLEHRDVLLELLIKMFWVEKKYVGAEESAKRSLSGRG